MEAYVAEIEGLNGSPIWMRSNAYFNAQNAEGWGKPSGPGAVSSTASTVNPSGTVVGAYTDSSGVTHGYQLYHGTFTTTDFPGSVFTFDGGNNPSGDIVGAYTDTSNVTHSFLLSHGVYTSFDPPGTVAFSDASGINPGGIIVGIFFDSSGKEHGFIRTP